MMRLTCCLMPPGGAADIVDDGGADLYRVLAQKPDFGAQLVAILVVYRRRAHGHGLVAPVTFNTGISQGSRSSSFVRPASRSERLPKISYSLSYRWRRPPRRRRRNP